MTKFVFAILLLIPVLAFTQDKGIPKKAEVLEIEREQDLDIEIYSYSEVMPQFPGGTEAMNQFIADNVVYPSAALEKGIEGRVFLEFVVRKTGELEDIKVLKGIGGGCEEEAMRVVKMMPRWTNGTMRGEAVNVMYMISFKFPSATSAPNEK